jgi:hypothetical protein
LPIDWEDACLFGYGNGGGFVVACHHANADSCFVAHFDCFSDSVAKGVFYSDEGDEG